MPTREEIIASIGDIARESSDLPPGLGEIGPETRLMKGGLGLDSYSMVEMISRIEERYGVEFREADFREDVFRSIGTLGGLVHRYVNGGSVDAQPEPPAKLDWDYSALASSYAQRPNYADAAVDGLVDAAGLAPGDPVLDLGAGTGHLTSKLAARGFDVTALEPNPRMREIGMPRTAGLANVRWRDALMERTGLPSGAFALASYGSSFGVADHATSLREAHRVLRPGGAVAVLFNHRDLDDALQGEIEALIHREVPRFAYGSRRQDQTTFIESSGLFGRVQRIEVPFLYEQRTDAWIEGWSAHATLARQAGDRFPSIVAAIGELAGRLCGDTVRVPYKTRVWIGWRQ